MTFTPYPFTMRDTLKPFSVSASLDAITRQEEVGAVDAQYPVYPLAKSHGHQSIGRHVLNRDDRDPPQQLPQTIRSLYCMGHHHHLSVRPAFLQGIAP